VIASRRARDITPVRIAWLWRGRIPLGKITILDGDPGLGKSLLTIDIAARLSTGRSMPCDDAPAEPPADVVILNNEDDPGDTIRPRLEAAGADLARVHIIEHVTDADAGADHAFTLPVHTAALAALVHRTGARLVVIDPLMSALDTSVNTYRDQAVRRALLPLQEMARFERCAVLLVRHLNKAAGLSALYRGGGTIGFIGAARAGLLVAPDPVEPDRRLLAPVKYNLAARPATIAYAVAGEPPTVSWLGPADLTADDLLGATAAPRSEQSEAHRAARWLRDRLAEGPRTAADLIDEAHDEGIARSTLHRARRAIGAIATREGFGAAGRWIWALAPERDAATGDGGPRDEGKGGPPPAADSPPP
jgi:hypothetical protein